eukprot:TRINITY_DN17715_c0_g1_i2.p1 TRINITY_DN17715_c0_g1~~TRINITY_DN17715_c0_g1_i2.p1  ORF type:complete len:285 (+),score=25.81 TRINITY_DN17715_c0_g1_i2:38-892(+)
MTRRCSIKTGDNNSFLLNYVREEKGAAGPKRVMIREPSDEELNDSRSTSLSGTGRSETVKVSEKRELFKETRPSETPDVIWVSGLPADDPFHEANGRYEISKNTLHGMPVWVNDEHRLYSDTHDCWKIIKGEGMHRNIGLFTSGDGPHGGRMPHEAKTWFRYKRNSWEKEPNIVITPTRDVTTKAGFIYVIGRTKGLHSCKLCKTSLQPGNWLRCNSCPPPADFDLCRECFHDGHHIEHQFTSMDYSSFIPKAFLCNSKPLTETVYNSSKEALNRLAVSPVGRK